ncbi:hypothetical protein GCM10009805_21080 [Leucobacter chromiireducens subsp. solipictus]
MAEADECLGINFWLRRCGSMGSGNSPQPFRAICDHRVDQRPEFRCFGRGVPVRPHISGKHRESQSRELPGKRNGVAAKPEGVVNEQHSGKFPGTGWRAQDPEHLRTTVAVGNISCSELVHHVPFPFERCFVSYAESHTISSAIPEFADDSRSAPAPHSSAENAAKYVLNWNSSDLPRNTAALGVPAKLQDRV